MDINNYRLAEAPANTAVDAIIAQIEAMTDLDGQQLFPTVKRGLSLLNGTLPESATPQVDVWQDSAGYMNDSVQMLFAEGEHILDIYITCHSGNGDDLQAQRERLCWHLLQHLQMSDSGTTDADGLEPGSNWRFPNPQRVDVDHTSPFKKIADFVPVIPPWYVSRISIAIEVFPIESDE